MDSIALRSWLRKLFLECDQCQEDLKNHMFRVLNIYIKEHNEQLAQESDTSLSFIDRSLTDEQLNQSFEENPLYF